MNENIKGYIDYLNNTIDIKYGKLSVFEGVNGESKLYSLIDSLGNAVYSGFDNIIDLGIKGFICISKNASYNKMVHYSQDGKIIGSSNQYYCVDLHDEYFRMTEENCNDSSGEYFDYISGRFYPPFAGGYTAELFYDRTCPINVAKVSKSEGFCYKYFTKDNYKFCFEEAEFEDASSFKNGIATVKAHGVYYAINMEGDNVFDKTFVYLGTFDEGIAPFSLDGKLFGYIDVLGNVVIEPILKTADNFKDGIANVYTGRMFKKGKEFIDFSGNEVNILKNDEINLIVENGNYRFYDKYNGRYSNIKYPIVKHYEEICLCNNKDELYLFSKKTGEYILLFKGNILKDEIKLLDRLLVVKDKYYYIGSDGKVIELTSIVDINNIVSIGGYINDNTTVVSYVDFMNGNIPVKEVEEEIVEEEETLEEDISKVVDGFGESVVVDNGTVDHLYVHNKVLEEKSRINSEKEELLRQIDLLNERIVQVENKSKYMIKVDENILFNNMGDYKEIKEELKEDLIYLDLSNISFDNVKVSGLDLSNTNVSIDPQTIYNKDMSYGVYDGIKFISNNFNGVNTDNSSFKNCDVPFSEFEIADVI